MTPPCPHQPYCGGCSRQGVPYAEQIAAKEARVRAALEAAGVVFADFQPILPSPDTRFYRNKMEYSFGDARDTALLGQVKGGPRVALPADPFPAHLGLHPKGRFSIVSPTPECELMSEEARRLMAVTADWATRHRIPIFLRKDGSGMLRHLVLREGKNTGERMMSLVAKSDTPAVPDLVESVKASGVEVTTLMWARHDGKSDVANHEALEIFWGAGTITERVGDLVVRVRPASFMQTNTRAAEGMLRLLRGWVAEGARPGRLFDVYCGSGVIGLSMADLFDEVTGIELNPSGVADARATAAANNVGNARFVEGKAEDIVPHAGLGPDTAIIVDPPRAGLHAKVVEALLASNAGRIFYVSCNPDTLARDLALLGARYAVAAVRPMDFFPHTDHVETAVRLELKTC